ncbi:MAG: HNH endonuclease [Bdellovibrionales bacterium]|nr:HNH endonuclease [Bdellovibrionales bacterium]
MKRVVYHRDHGHCVRCGSTRALQYDHIQPICLGGRNDVSNLRLTCRSCNQRFAIEKLGNETMEAHLITIDLVTDMSSVFWFPSADKYSPTVLPLLTRMRAEESLDFAFERIVSIFIN